MDSLPLIPQKGGECGDARPVLREVFREQVALPALPSPPGERSSPPAGARSSSLEDQLQRRRARALAATQCPCPCDEGDESLLQRKDLVPAVHQLATMDKSLWVRATVGPAGECPGALSVQGQAWSPRPIPAPLVPYSHSPSQLSLSFGEPIHPKPETAPEPPKFCLGETPQHILPPAPLICIPQQIHFVDFTVGKLHVCDLRMVNVGKCKLRLSLSPPSSRELSVVLTGPRGLIMDAGCDATLQVHFVPRDVRPIGDQLVIRVSTGRTIVMPIECYVRPPLLQILVPRPPMDPQVDAPTNPQDDQRLGDVVDQGARLLGAVHCTPLLLRCDNPRATFCVLTEQAWQERVLSVRRENEMGVVAAGEFGMWPAVWQGGGAVWGGAWCVPKGAGLKEAMLRVMTCSGIARPLQLLADVLMYSPGHVTMVAQSKDYDLLSPEDLQCQYYVDAGMAYPHRSLNNNITVQLINNSPIDYSYYWTSRPWGECACGTEGNEDSIPGSSNNVKGQAAEVLTGAVRLEATCGILRGHQTVTVHVHVPDVGGALGTQRAALMLVLLDVPTASLPIFRPMATEQVSSVVRRRLVPPPLAPGLHVPPVEVCDVVSVQLEVWWHVMPLRFVLDPPLLLVPYTRRVSSLQLGLRATLLCGGSGASVSWRLPPRTLAPPPPALGPTHSVETTLHLPLKAPLDGRPLTDIVTLEVKGAEWSASCVVTRVCSSRHPRLRPIRRLLGCVVPAERVRTRLEVTNDTLKPSCWVAHAWRWLGEREPSEACRNAVPCPACQQRACTCHMLHPTCGHHQPGDVHQIQYDVYAPDVEGCAVTLVSLVETLEDTRVGHGGQGALAGRVGTGGRAALVGYRVLAPRLVLRVRPCEGTSGSEGALDGIGGFVLRPVTVLWLGRRVCCRLTITNTTPLPTNVRWQTPPKGQEAIHVTFIPNNFELGSYAHVDIQVMVEAMRVCARQLWALEALVQHAPLPTYLLVDAAVAGLELEIEWPLGGAAEADSYVVVRRLQPEGQVPTLASPDFVFAEEDCKSAPFIAERRPLLNKGLQQGSPLSVLRLSHPSVDLSTEWEGGRCHLFYELQNVCLCRRCLKYIPSPPPLPRDPNLSPPSIEIVYEAPTLTVVCACCGAGDEPMAASAHHQPLCVQFWCVPVRSVARRVLKVRNKSPLTARFEACVRHWSRAPLKRPGDPWQAGVRSNGVALLVRPARGLLAVGGILELEVLAYADTWGLYRDQLLLQVAGVPPLVVDVWLQAVGSPLQLIAATSQGDDNIPTLWISPSDEERKVCVRNSSQTTLLVRPYVTTEYERASHALPLRLYYRLVELPPTPCPACDFLEEKEEPEPGTGVELWLGPDFGRQEGAPWRLTEGAQRLTEGGLSEWRVRRDCTRAEGNGLLVLRANAEPDVAEYWQRPEPAPLLLRLRPAPRSARLLARDGLRIELNALRLPHGEVIRIRKRVRVQNAGNGWLSVTMTVEEPWSIVTGGRSACGCGPRAAGRRLARASLKLPPRATDSVCVELRLLPGALISQLPTPSTPPMSSPRPQPAFPPPSQSSPRSITARTPTPTPISTPPPIDPLDNWILLNSNRLTFHDENNGLLHEVCLTAWLERPPRLVFTPAVVDFGCVCAGDTRTACLTLSHTGRTETLDVTVEVSGGDWARVWPPRVSVGPCGSETAQVVVSGLAPWQEAVSPLETALSAVTRAAPWLRAAALLRLTPSRDHKCHRPPHDFTTIQPPAPLHL